MGVWEDWLLYLRVAVCAAIPALTDDPFHAPGDLYTLLAAHHNSPTRSRNHTRDHRERNEQKMIMALSLSRLDTEPCR